MKGGDGKKKDDWFDLIAKTMISNFYILTSICLIFRLALWPISFMISEER